MRGTPTNVYRQKQAGYVVASVTLPLGDLSSWQMRELADIARRFSGDSVRTTVEQNIVLRWVSETDLPDLYRELTRIGLGAPGAGTIVDVTACPGTDTCKLGISSSRGLAGELRTRLAAKSFNLDEAVKNLRIKISGCFNSCGQHHIADLGFYGMSLNVGNRKVPHFQVVLGGKWQDNAGAYGLALGSRAFETDSGRDRSHHGPLCSRTQELRELSGLREADRQERPASHAGGPDEDSSV